jgi:hypothetical protein
MEVGKMSGLLKITAFCCLVLLLLNKSFPIVTKDYEGIKNPVNLSEYGYFNPFEGFIGATLTASFFSSNYLSQFDKQHTGADFEVSSGTELRAIFSGTVTESQDFDYQINVRKKDNYHAYYDSRIIIKCTNPQYPDKSFLIIYGHVKNSPFSGEVEAGEKVEVIMGEKIGEIADAYTQDNVRVSSKDHFHLGINVNDGIYYGGGWGFGQAPGTATIDQVMENGFRDPFEYLSENFSFPLWDVQYDYAWFYSYVHFLYGIGIVSCQLDGSFGPDKTISRAEFIKMVVLALEKVLGRDLFNYCAVLLNTWQVEPEYYDYISDAYLFKNNNISPSERIAFWDPNMAVDFSQGVTREEAAHIVRNALELTTSSIGSYELIDVQVCYYAPWVYDVWKISIIDGYDDKTYKPFQVLNRSEAAKMIRNILKYKGYLNNNCNVCPEICNKD